MHSQLEVAMEHILFSFLFHSIQGVDRLRVLLLAFHKNVIDLINTHIYASIGFLPIKIHLRLKSTLILFKVCWICIALKPTYSYQMQCTLAFDLPNSNENIISIYGVIETLNLNV